MECPFSTLILFKNSTSSACDIAITLEDVLDRNYLECAFLLIEFYFARERTEASSARDGEILTGDKLTYLIGSLEYSLLLKFMVFVIARYLGILSFRWHGTYLMSFPCRWILVNVINLVFFSRYSFWLMFQ